MKILKIMAKLLVALSLLFLALWIFLSLHFQASGWAKLVAGGLVLLVTFYAIGGLFIRRWRTLSAGLMAVFLVGFFVWWYSITPRHDRIWLPEMAHGVTGTITGDQVVLHDVRNFAWESASDYTERWETRSYDLSKLEEMDAILSYWGNDNIAHTLVSFGFSDGQRVVFSVETRKEDGEVYSSLGGLFKKYELIVIAADEADILHLRTHAREPIEDVYLYPIDSTEEDRRALFLGLVGKANQLAEKPEFYHTITANCTTVVYNLIREFRPDITFDPAVILSGQLPDYLAERGSLRWPQPYGDVRSRAAITKKAQAAGPALPYSEAIRQ